MDELRFGIIGTGMMGREHIANLANLAELPGASVAAISDPDEGSLAEAAGMLGSAVTVHADHRAMLDAGGLDAVIVASPNHTHRGVLDDLWGGGVHVMVEKRLCTTVEDCRAVSDAAARHDGLVWVGLEYRYMPAVARLLQRARSGDAGRIRMVSIREHRFPFLHKVGARFSRNTGGTLVEKCCHFFDLMNLVLGERPVRVLASGAQDVNHLDERYGGETPDILDNAFVIVEYPSGARALLDLCMFAEGSRWEQEIVVVGDAVRSGGPAGVTVEDGLWSVAMGVAAHRSIDEGRPVELVELVRG